MRYAPVEERTRSAKETSHEKEYHRNAEEKSTEPQSAQRELNRRNRPGGPKFALLHFEPGGRGRRGQRGRDHEEGSEPRLRDAAAEPPGVGGGDALAVGESAPEGDGP